MFIPVLGVVFNPANSGTRDEFCVYGRVCLLAQALILYLDTSAGYVELMKQKNKGRGSDLPSTRSCCIIPKL